MTEKFDIYNMVEGYRKNLETFHLDSNISQQNKDLVAKFLHECEVGKTVLHRQKKKINCNTLSKYLFSLKVVLRHLSADLDKLPAHDKDNVDLEKFIISLENDGILKLNGQPYSEKTKREVKVVLKKFYKWLYGNNEAFPPLVSWIDTYQEYKEISALLREAIEQWIGSIDTLKNRTAIMVLFDSGARIGEFLNVRMKHVTYDEQEQCYKLRIEFSKTKRRTIWVPIATSYLKQYIAQMGEPAQYPEKFLFDFTYNSLRIALRRSSIKCLKKVITPHDLRHSSATYYCKKLNRYELCYRYGWSMSSDMPDRYIDREGLVETTALKAVKQEKTEYLLEENKKLKEDFMFLKDKLERLEKAEHIRQEPDKMVSMVLQQLSKEHPQKVIEIIQKLGIKDTILNLDDGI